MKKDKYENMNLGLYDKGSDRKILKPNMVMKNESKKNEDR
jgi:hypothetical protein